MVTGSVLIRDGISLVSLTPTGSPLLSASGSIVVGTGSTVVLTTTASQNGVIEVVKSSSSLQGQFASVVVNVPPSSTCVVSIPTYSSTTLSVTLTLCASTNQTTYTGLTTPEIIGLSFGVVCGAILIAIAIVFVTNALIAKKTAVMKTDLKQNHLEQIARQTDAKY